MGNSSIEISDIIGRHKDQPAFVMGLGPSLSRHIPILPKLKEKDFVLLSTNYWYRILEERVDYWVIANNVVRIEKHWKVMNDFAKPVFYADSVDLTNKKFIHDRLTCEYLAYDERHFDAKDGRLTIQEELSKLSGNDEKYSSAGTVALHMLAFAILMKCNPIYVAGIDLDYKGRTNNYAKGKKPPFENKQIDIDAWDKSKDAIADAFRVLYESAKQMGIDVFNAGNNPKLNFIPSREINYGD